MLFALLVAGFVSAQGAVREAECHMTNAYPPPENATVPHFQVDLDTDALDRWNGVVAAMKEEIIEFVDFVFHYDFAFMKELFVKIDRNQDEILDRMPNDWGEEIQGIAAHTGLDVAKLILVNMAYEIFGVCTSIVAQQSDGTVIHGRNLDFGLYPGINWTDFQWELTEVLRPTIFTADMMKNGQVLYKGVYFGGYIGMLTGVREKAMSISVDTRFDDNYDKYLLEWCDNPDDTLQFLTLTTRRAIEETDNYGDAVQLIEDTPIMCPAYVIIGGQAEEGSVVTIGPNMTLVDYWDIPNALPDGKGASDNWYVLETNYDHWEEPPWFDDRRYPAEDCMNIIGQDDISLPTLFNVLNGKPNRNRLTTYTALMEVETGHLEAYYQYCTDPDCVPW